MKNKLVYILNYLLSDKLKYHLGKLKTCLVVRFDELHWILIWNTVKSKLPQKYILMGKALIYQKKYKI